MTGIIAAVKEEAEAIKGEMTEISEEKIGDISFFRGKLCDREVVFVQSGIGKVNAAVTTTLLIYRYEVNQIIFSGVAGSLDNRICVGDIVVSEDLVQHDFDACEFGYRKGQIPDMDTWSFKADRELLERCRKIEIPGYKMFHGRILTGDQFINRKEEKEQLGRSFEALCTDMESGSVAQVCYRFGVKFIVIRSISDSLTDESGMEYDKFVKLAAQNSKEILKQMLR